MVRAGGPPLLFGGGVDATFRRMTEFGAGWIMGGGSPATFAAGAEKARRAWSEAGRAGQPRLAAVCYVSLGDDADSRARRYLSDYYAYLGEYAAQAADSALTTPDMVAHALEAFSEAGCDELILFPCNPNIAQVALTAKAVGL